MTPADGVYANDSETTSTSIPLLESTSKWRGPVVVVLIIPLILVTIAGNTLVIAAVVTTRRLRSITNCFVSSLAAADLLVGMAVMPFTVPMQLYDNFWEKKDLLCKFWVCLDILLCTASILSLCAISIDRYLAVTQPLVYSRRRRSKRLAGLMIIAVWILAGLIISIPFIFRFPPAVNSASDGCTYNMHNTYFVIFSATGSFFLPMLVVLFVYARISCVIGGRHRNLKINGSDAQHPRHATLVERSKSFRTRRSDSSPMPERGSPSCDQSINHSEAAGTCKKSGINRVARETKTACTLALVVGGFVACWLPFFILYLVTPFLQLNPPEALKIVLTWLGWINSAINPFIYAFYSADFRLAFWRLTCRKCLKSRFFLNQGPEMPPPVSWRRGTSKKHVKDGALDAKEKVDDSSNL